MKDSVDNIPSGDLPGTKITIEFVPLLYLKEQPEASSMLLKVVPQADSTTRIAVALIVLPTKHQCKLNILDSPMCISPPDTEYSINGRVRLRVID